MVLCHVKKDGRTTKKDKIDENTSCKITFGDGDRNHNLSINVQVWNKTTFAALEDVKLLIFLRYSRV